MAFHREIKVNYQVLETVVQSLKKYESALETMQRSIASMDRIIAENEGKTFTALSKIKHDFDDEIIECKDEVKDLYSSISNYVSDMKGIIYAPSAGRMTLVDRNDIYLNMKAIKLACESIRGVGSSEYGSTLNTDNYEAGSDALNKILSDVNRTARMRAAIAASSKKIDNYYEEIERIYKTKIVKYENKDDSHASKMRRLHSKYTSQEEARREGDEASTDVVKGVIAWFKDLVLGAWDLVVLVVGIGTYGVYKIVGANPPDWSKNRVEGLKGVTPITLIESICQSASDTAAEKGYAYSAGYIATEAASMVIGAGLAKNAVKGPKLASKADDLSDAARGAAKFKGKPMQLHHYATNKSRKYTKRFNEIAKKYNLDLDGEWNKKLLPHQGRHPDVYHDYVLDRMRKIDRVARGNQKKFLKLFDTVKKQIDANPDMLYKNYWK